MKKLFTFIGFVLLPILLLCQIPQAFNYQATVRNSEGVIQKNLNVDFEIEILLSGNPVPVYSEKHLGKTTGPIGVVNFQVGMGTDTLGNFSTINWGAGQYQIKVNLNDGDLVRLADIVAVPFALYAQSSGEDNDWINVGDSILYRNNVKVGIGTNSPLRNLHIIDSDISLNNDNVGGILLGNLTGLNLAIDQNEIMARDSFGISRLSLQAEGGEIRIHSGDGDPETNITILNNGSIGIGTNTPNARFQIDDTNDASISGGGLIISGRVGQENVVIDENEIMAREGGQRSPLYLQNNGGDLFIQGFENGSEEFQVGIGINDGNDDFDPDARLHVNGITTTSILKITGGSDIKEDLNSTEKLEPGEVVVIDEKNPGNIKRTNEEYDRKVAGIISGANGINPGLSLSQDDVLEGDYPLTMLGRVYVKVIGIVKIGDMLTTSSKPGYAMSVKDYSKAHGTVIGKAMTSNEEIEGMVLILVNLQ